MTRTIERNEAGLPVVVEGGQWRSLGCLEPHPLCALPAWSDERPVLGAAEYKEGSLHESWPEVGIDDQGQSNACVGEAIETAFSYAWLQGGLKFKAFSPTYVYGLINGGRDQGSVVSDGMTAVKMYGIAEESIVPQGMIFRSQFPSAAYANARRHRAVEVLQCRTFQDICTALSLGFSVVSGIWVGNNFGQLDSDGLAPLPDRVVGGHALAHIGLKWSARRSRWLVLTQNSWGEKWGMRDATGTGGFCYLSEEHWANMRIDAWAICGVFNDPDDPSDDVPVAR